MTGTQYTHEIKVSIEVSIGFVFRHLRNDPSPGVRANEVDGMRKWDEGNLRDMSGGVE